MRKGKPTVQDVRDLVTKCNNIYNQRDNRFVSDEKYYECNFKDKLAIPKEFEADRVIPPTSRDMVDAAVDHTDISHARVFVNKKGTSGISEESAEMLRKFGLGVIHRTNVESDIAPGRVGAKHFWLHGLAVYKTVWDADRWLDKPAQKDGESDDHYAERIDEWRAESHLSIPIIIQAINPACIMPDPYYGGKLFVIERHKRLCFDAEKIWPHWKNPKNRKVSDEVDYISYWDKDFRCDLVDDVPVLRIKGGVVEHKYGFIPYTLIESGLGNLAEDAKPEKRYVGILRYMYDLLVSEATNYTMCDILMKRETMLGGYITGMDAGTVPVIKQEYGKWWPVGNKDVKFNKWEGSLAPEAAYAHLALTHDYIAAHAAPRSLRGLSETGVRSGADRRLVIAEAMSKMRYSEDAFANGWAQVLAKCAMLVKNVIPGDFDIWARTPTDEFDIEVKKKLFREPFNFYVEFSPISEEDEYRRQDSLVKLWNGGNGLVTKTWARKQMSNIDPKAMEREEDKERLKMSPMFNQLKDQYLSSKFQEALQQMGLPAGMMPPGEGTPIPSQGAGRGMVPPIPQRQPLGSMGNLKNQWKQQLQGSQSGIQGRGRGGGGNRG